MESINSWEVVGFRVQTYVTPLHYYVTWYNGGDILFVQWTDFFISFNFFRIEIVK